MLATLEIQQALVQQRGDAVEDLRGREDAFAHHLRRFQCAAADEDGQARE